MSFVNSATNRRFTSDGESPLFSSKYFPKPLPSHPTVVPSDSTPPRRLKVAFLTTDNREQQQCYHLDTPFFGTAPEALLEGFSAFPGEIEVHVISCTRKPMTTPEKLAENIWFHQPLVPHLGWGRTFFLGCAMAARRVIRFIQPDIVHGQGTERDCGVSMMLAPELPKVLTIHGHMERIAEIVEAKPFSYYWMAKNLEKLAVKHADGVISITNYTKQRLAGKAKATWVVPNAVDQSFFEINSPGNGGLILCVASMSRWKRQLELIHALDPIISQLDRRVVFLGGGIESVYGQLVMSEISKRPWCNYAGTASRAELKDWLYNASLLILPSIEDNCPMVILEAMAAGVPVAASSIGGIPDLIENRETGYLFDPHDPDSIRRSVLQWKSEGEKGSNIATMAKSSARRRFHPREIAKEHLKIYEQLRNHGS